MGHLADGGPFVEARCAQHQTRLQYVVERYSYRLPEDEDTIRPISLFCLGPEAHFLDLGDEDRHFGDARGAAWLKIEGNMNRKGIRRWEFERLGGVGN